MKRSTRSLFTFVQKPIISKNKTEKAESSSATSHQKLHKTFARGHVQHGLRRTASHPAALVRLARAARYPSSLDFFSVNPSLTDFLGVPDTGEEFLTNFLVNRTAFEWDDTTAVRAFCIHCKGPAARFGAAHINDENFEKLEHAFKRTYIVEPFDSLEFLRHLEQKDDQSVALFAEEFMYFRAKYCANVVSEKSAIRFFISGVREEAIRRQVLRMELDSMEAVVDACIFEERLAAEQAHAKALRRLREEEAQQQP